MNIPRIDVSDGTNNVYTFDTSISEKGGELTILLKIIFLEHDLKLNSNAPQRWSVNQSSGGNAGWIATSTGGPLSNPLVINVLEGIGIHEVPLNLDIIACKATECLPKKCSVVYRVHQKADASSVLTEEREILVK